MFYDLSKEERVKMVSTICAGIETELGSGELKTTVAYFSDSDTYIRKSAYLSVGRIWFDDKNLQAAIIKMLDGFFVKDDFKVRQTVINSAGEIGKKTSTKSCIFLIKVCSTNIILREMR
ncbi:MAG: hypothetical protein JWP81_3204 [Ferruginibacter sp.]|nr:hypothetical protein [Ferruginibacter sp.]